MRFGFGTSAPGLATLTALLLTRLRREAGGGASVRILAGAWRPRLERLPEGGIRVTD